MDVVCEWVRRVAVTCNDDHCVPDCDNQMSETSDSNTPAPSIPWVTDQVSTQAKGRYSLMSTNKFTFISNIYPIS